MFCFYCEVLKSISCDVGCERNQRIPKRVGAYILLFPLQVAFLVPVLTSMFKQGHLRGGFLSGDTQTPSALCIAPTRELAVQIHKEVCKFSNETVVTAAVCYGGVSVQHQLDKLRRGCHILVATPGRLDDFVTRNKV